MAYSELRNLDKDPYSPREAEAAKSLSNLIGLGGGDDPVRFLITSHRDLLRQRKILKAKSPDIFEEIARHSEDETQVKPMRSDLSERIARLTAGVSSDPDESLGDEDIL